MTVCQWRFSPIHAITSVRPLTGFPDWAAYLALTLPLAYRIVFGNSEGDARKCAVPLSRLAETIHLLGGIVLEMIHGNDDGDDDGGEDRRPSPPSPELLRELLERRRPVKAVAKA